MNTMVMCSNTRVFIGEACKYCVANKTCSEYKEYLKERGIYTRNVFEKILDYMMRLCEVYNIYKCRLFNHIFDRGN